MMIRVFMLVFLAMLFGGCAEFDASGYDVHGNKKKRVLEPITKKIVNGSLDFGHASVVGVVSQTSTCTGTIITPTVVGLPLLRGKKWYGNSAPALPPHCAR